MDTMALQPGPTGASTETSAAESSVQPNALRLRLARFWRGPAPDAPWARPALLTLLAATSLLYVWDLTASGWANSFYTAAAQAGSESWKALFFGSFDASNAITVDKPPAALWIMGLSVRLLGLSSLSILLPEALMGVATVAVVFATVRRQFGAGAGLLAGTVVALTPVAALMFRFNNPNALLTLLMALATWAMMRAIEVASARWMALVGAFVGLGFLTKTLQVLLVIPFLGIAYLLAAPTTLRRRIGHSLVALGTAVVSAGWWVAIVELVPASTRPYIGGSQTNSFLELTFGYNGFGRLSGDETGSVGGGRGWGETGLLRMFSSGVGDQVSWLIPSALILLAVGLVIRGRRPRTDLRRAAYLVWGGWLVVTMLVFSLMAGIFHEYYTVALAPAIGALVGMGAAEAWEQRETILGGAALAVASAAAAVWGFVLLSGTTAYGDSLRYAVLVLGLTAAVLLLLVRAMDLRAVPVVAAAALVAALAGPAAYTVSTVSVGHTGSIVTAGPAGTRGTMGGPGGRGAFAAQVLPPGQLGGGAFGPGTSAQRPTGGFGGGAGGLLDANTPSAAVVAALSADAGSYRWVAAAVGSQNAAGLQIATQLPVMSIGGFNGSDPSPTLGQFQQDVANGEIHYFAASGRDGFGGPGGQMGGSSAAFEISTWVQESFASVTLGGSTFYDLTKPV